MNTKNTSKRKGTLKKKYNETRFYNTVVYISRPHISQDRILADTSTLISLITVRRVVKPLSFWTHS